MNFTLLVSAVLFATCAYATPSENKKTLGAASCKGIKIELPRHMASTRKRCLMHNFSTRVVKKTGNISFLNRLTCATVCELRGYGLISTDNTINERSIAKFVEKVFHESVSADLIGAIMICANEKGQNLQVSDGNCESFSPFIACTKKSIASICDQ